jgi:hypothetical protein
MTSPRTELSRPSVAAASETANESPSAEPRKPNSIISQRGTFNDPQRRQAMIAEAAYYFAQQRGFHSGHELEDWVAAEQQIDAALAAEQVAAFRGDELVDAP